MKLKRFFENPYRAFSVLARHGLFNRLGDETFIKLQFRAQMGKWPDLKNPKTYNEKLQWLKLYDRKPLYTKLVDKYAVRQHIADSIGEEYLIPLVGGPWESFDEIDFDSLPDRFVLKCTHDSGGVVICTNKASFNVAKARQKIETSLKRNYYLCSREWPYKEVPRRIIAEQYMADESGTELKDYKFMCFGGEIKCSFVCSDRFSNKGVHITFFDRDWNRLPFERSHPASKEPIRKPMAYEKMLQLAQQLSNGFPFVRVDFYEINGKIYFGEITLYPASGLAGFTPEEWDSIIGSWIDLPSVKSKE